MYTEETLVKIKTRYEKFRKSGDGDPLALKKDVEKLLEEAKAEGASKAVEELEEILIDLSFLTEEIRCNCQITKCHC
ncbi:MAG: hypothetical protein QXM52_04190 [Candidatus Bathyarchaeia archaeon]